MRKGKRGKVKKCKRWGREWTRRKGDTTVPCGAPRICNVFATTSQPNIESNRRNTSLTTKVSPSALIWISPAGLSGSTRYLTNVGGRPSWQALIPKMLLSSRTTTAQVHEPSNRKHRRNLTCTCQQSLCEMTTPQRRSGIIGCFNF